MSWLVWTIIIIIILVIISSAGSGKSSASKKPSKSAKQIANEITTIAQYNALERKVEKADEKRQEFTSYDSRSQKQEEKLDDKYQILQKAFDIASKKTLQWQFIPNLDINTPYSILKNGYKIFKLNEYEEALSKLGNDESEWHALSGDNEPDEKDPEFKFVLKVSEITSNEDLSRKDKIKKINSLASRNTDEASSYFDLDSETTPGEQWFTENT